MSQQWIADPVVSERMRRIRSSRTGLEKAMQALLRSAGIRFRSQQKHFGKPDLRVVGTKLLIFCDSSFWHGRNFEERHFSRNRALWAGKIRKNIRRDRLVNRTLSRRGWHVLRFWDFEISENPGKVLRAVRLAMEREHVDLR